MKNWNLKTKLIATFLAVGLTPLLISNTVSFVKASNEIENEAEETVKIIASNKARDIASFFENDASSLVDIADMPIIRNGLEDLGAGFSQYSGMKLSDVEMGKLASYYNNDFQKAYTEKNPKETFNATGYLSKLSNAGLQAQYDFIGNNEHPLGKKLELVSPTRKSLYGSMHEKYHRDLKSFVERHQLYDLFLINPEGDVVYTVFKETDFGANVLSGPLSETGLARAFKKSATLKQGDLHIEDFAIYGPSYEAPASFASTPVYVRGKLVGVLVVQLSLENINSLVNEREGLGEKGQTLLLGSDDTLRADAFRSKETFNVAASFAKNNPLTIKSDALELAQEGKSGVYRGKSVDGTEVISYYQPIKIGDLTWYITTELAHEEVFAGLANLRILVIVMVIAAAFAIGGTSFWFGGNIAKNLGRVIGNLAQSNQNVSASSNESAASATELSEAATEQAASLQETMASIEEISAMVNQNAESALKARTAVETNAKSSNEGKQNVVKMIQAITEIKNTNDEILQQMESSNKEFGEIVKIISDIGEKTKVINDIVFQTKLLSFNASVEAARAGEHGKGFAVVAEEVGNLAQMSGNAAKEITDMLASSIKKVNAIVEDTTAKVDHLVEIGKDKISMGQSTAELCREALEKITENAVTVNSMVAEIANASKEQAQGVQEINKAISQLDQVTQQNSAVAQLSSTQAEKLNVEAQSLSSAVASLVAFVNGGDSNNTVHKNPPTSPRSHSSIVESKVVSMNEHKSKSQSKSSKPISEQERSLRAKITSKAAGSDSVPSNNDPGFEEF